MTPTDEAELHRLCAMLHTIDQGLDPGSPLREALSKAGFALGLGFIHGMRPKIEAHYQQMGQPLTDAQREHLLSMGIDPDASLR